MKARKGLGTQRSDRDKDRAEEKGEPVGIADGSISLPSLAISTNLTPKRQRSKLQQIQFTSFWRWTLAKVAPYDFGQCLTKVRQLTTHDII